MTIQAERVDERRPLIRYFDGLPGFGETGPWELWFGSTADRPLPASLGDSDALSVIGTDPDDSAAGKGVRKLRIEYLDENGWWRFIDVATAGVGIFPTGVDAYRVLNVYSLEVGSSGGPVGAIGIAIGADAQTGMPIGVNRNMGAWWTVPRGFRLKLKNIELVLPGLRGGPSEPPPPGEPPPAPEDPLTYGANLESRALYDLASGSVGPWVLEQPLKTYQGSPDRAVIDIPSVHEGLTDLRMVTLTGTPATLQYTARMHGSLILLEQDEEGIDKNLIPPPDFLGIQG